MYVTEIGVRMCAHAKATENCPDIAEDRPASISVREATSGRPARPAIQATKLDSGSTTSYVSGRPRASSKSDKLH